MLKQAVDVRNGSGKQFCLLHYKDDCLILIMLLNNIDQ